MKSNFLGFDLMTVNQVGKEIIFNEVTSLLEQISCRIVKNFIGDVISGERGGLYIISNTASEYNNYLAYYANAWQYIAPKVGMIFYIETAECFYKFTEDNWEVIRISNIK